MNKNVFGLSVLLLVGCSLPAVAGFNFATIKGWFMPAPKVTTVQMIKNVVTSNVQKLAQTRVVRLAAKHPYMFAGTAAAAVLGTVGTVVGCKYFARKVKKAATIYQV